MKKLLIIVGALFLILTATSNLLIAQNVAINESGSAPNSNAILDVNPDNNHNKGVLLPRLTTTERTGMTLGTADAGLTVFDTDTQSYWWWDGSAWVEVGVDNRYWKLTGNSGTSTGTNFLGTIDSVDLAIKTNNLDVLRITAAGNVGIGTISPSYPLSVTSATADITGSFTNTEATTDNFGVYGECAVSDYWGYGGYFKGGYVGAYGRVSPTGSDYYYGLAGIVYGGSGENKGLYAYAYGSGTNYAVYAAATGGTDKGVYASVNDNGDIGVYAINNSTSTTEDYTTSAIEAESSCAADGISGNTVYNAVLQAWGTTSTNVDGIGLFSQFWPNNNWGYGAWTQGGYYGIRAEGNTGNYYKANNTYYSGGILAQGMVGVNAIGSEIGITAVSDGVGLLCIGNKENNDPAAFFDGNIIRKGYDAMIIKNEEDNTYVPAYTMVSNSINIQAVGQGSLDNGHAIINFDDNFSSIVSASDPIIVIITPTSFNTGNIVVTNTSVNGFEVTSDVEANGTFNWIAIGKIKGYDEQQTAIKSDYLSKDFLDNEAAKLYPESKGFPKFKSEEFFSTHKVKSKRKNSHEETRDPKIKKLFQTKKIQGETDFR